LVDFSNAIFQISNPASKLVKLFIKIVARALHSPITATVGGVIE
jgi:hypothetical protein